MTTEAIAGEGMIVTAGGLDMHVPRHAAVLFRAVQPRHNQYMHQRKIENAQCNVFVDQDAF